MVNDIRIETERLILRAPTIDDAQEINRAMNEVWQELQLWMSWAADGQNSLEATQDFLQNAGNIGMLPIAGFCRTGGQFVVMTGINANKNGAYETGYWVAKDFLGRGYATEATLAVLAYGFGAFGAERIAISHYEGNDKSRRVIEKAGFFKTGVSEKSHARHLDGVLLDEHRYEMTRDQWRRRCL